MHNKVAAFRGVVTHVELKYLRYILKRLYRNLSKVHSLVFTLAFFTREDKLAELARVDFSKSLESGNFCRFSHFGNFFIAAFF